MAEAAKRCCGPHSIIGRSRAPMWVPAPSPPRLCNDLLLATDTLWRTWRYKTRKGAKWSLSVLFRLALCHHLYSATFMENQAARQKIGGGVKQSESVVTFATVGEADEHGQSSEIQKAQYDNMTPGITRIFVRCCRVDVFVWHLRYEFLEAAWQEVLGRCCKLECGTWQSLWLSRMGPKRSGSWWRSISRGCVSIAWSR